MVQLNDLAKQIHYVIMCGELCTPFRIYSYIYNGQVNLLKVFQFQKHMHSVSMINNTWGLRAANVGWNTDAVQLAQRGGAGRSLL